MAVAQAPASTPNFAKFLGNLELDNSLVPVTFVYALALVDELYLNKGTHEPSLSNTVASFDEFLSGVEVKVKGHLPLKVKMSPEGALEFHADGAENSVWVLEPVL